MTEMAHMHSAPRCGAKTRNGVQLLPIMRAGGWRSVSIVARYIEKCGYECMGAVVGPTFDREEYDCLTGEVSPYLTGAIWWSRANCGATRGNP